MAQQDYALTPLGDQQTQKSFFFSPQTAYDSLKMSANPFTGAYICIRKCVLSYGIILEKRYNDCPGLSKFATPIGFAVFCKNSTLMMYNLDG